MMAGSKISLTPIEYDLLRLLAVNEGKLMTHPAILREVWGLAYGEESNYLHVYVSQLRRKIEPDPARPRYILNQAGVGYRLVDPARPSRTSFSLQRHLESVLRTRDPSVRVWARRRPLPLCRAGLPAAARPLDSRPESLDAFEIACRLAADDGARSPRSSWSTFPPLLPLDAHLVDAEDAARRLLERAGATGDAYGVRVATRVVRARDVGAAIVEQATADRDELIVIGSKRSRLAEAPRRISPDPVLHVLRAAPCRVMVVSGVFREAA